MTALLGIDLGTRRIGVAVAESADLPALPLTTLPRGRHIGADAVALQALIDRHHASVLVIGLPYEAAGQEGSQAALTRIWVESLRPLLEPEPTIVYRDERLSSHLAETRLGPMKRGRSGGPPTASQRSGYRARVDREAAAIILQDELDARRGARAATPDEPTQENGR